MDNDLEIYNAAIERASQNLKAKTKNETDGAAYLIAAQSMADHAQKDMNWKKALDSEHRKPAIEALNNELTSLQKTILTEVFPTDSTYEVAVLNATPGRLLLDIKRSGKYKVRGVKQGFRENTAVTDGPDFNYYSSVVRLFTVRIALCSRRSREHIIAIKDVSTAFLQSESYPDGQVKYVSFKNPITGKWHYYSQSGPIYGEASAPVRWENTIAPWIEKQGFERGENDRCIFYHPERDLLLLLYVDDCLAKGLPEDVEWIFALLGEEFDCKDTEYLDIDTSDISRLPRHAPSHGSRIHVPHHECIHRECSQHPRHSYSQELNTYRIACRHGLASSRRWSKERAPRRSQHAWLARPNRTMRCLLLLLKARTTLCIAYAFGSQSRKESVLISL